jgi:hypothetical protein
MILQIKELKERQVTVLDFDRLSSMRGASRKYFSFMYMTETLKELMCVTQANVPADNPSSNQKSCGYFQLAFPNLRPI